MTEIQKIQKNSLGEIHINDEIHSPYVCISDDCSNCSIYKYQGISITYSKCVDLCVFTDPEGNLKLIMFKKIN